MTALRFQTGGRHQKSPASLRDEKETKRESAGTERERERQRQRNKSNTCKLFLATTYYTTQLATCLIAFPRLKFEKHSLCFASRDLTICLVALCRVSHCCGTQLPLKGGRGCLMSPPCLESQGCHLIPLCYRLSCSSA